MTKLAELKSYDEESKTYIVTNDYNESKYINMTGLINPTYFYGFAETSITFKQDFKSYIQNRLDKVEFQMRIIDTLDNTGFRYQSVILFDLDKIGGVMQVLITFDNSGY